MFSPVLAGWFKSLMQLKVKSPGQTIQVLALGCGFTNEEGFAKGVIEEG